MASGLSIVFVGITNYSSHIIGVAILQFKKWNNLKKS
jgi:hypothetical protein